MTARSRGGGAPAAGRGAGTVVMGWRPPASGVPSAVRTRWPLTTQPGRRGTSARETVRTWRPRYRDSVATGTPAAASSATASSRRGRPGSPATSQATATWGREPRIFPTRPVSTRPGPDSTNTRAPAAYMASTWSTKRTGAATWRARVCRMASGSVG